MTQNNINTKNPLLQIISSSTSSVVTCSTTIPYDDSIPQQSTEGTQVLTVTITPKYSDSKLDIEFAGQVSSNGTATAITTALYQDSTANALCASACTLDTTLGIIGYLRHVMTSGTTSSTTFKIFIGPNTSTCYVNGDNAGTRYMGGVSSTTLTVKEYR